MVGADDGGGVALVFTFTHSERGQKRQRPPVVNYIFSN